VRRRLVRIAAPAAFLLAATVAVLLIHAGLRADEEEGRRATTIAPTTATRPVPAQTTRPPRRRPRRVYTVGSGDTLDQIALELDMTVEELLAVNPDVEPTELRVGQRLRVP
jgi:LysM repeat protein